MPKQKQENAQGIGDNDQRGHRQQSNLLEHANIRAAMRGNSQHDDRQADVREIAANRGVQKRTE